MSAKSRLSTKPIAAPREASANSFSEFTFPSLALVILAIGIALRQWQLGAAPFHADEAIHAWFTGNFGTYRYDPVYHGPLLYHLEAIVFGLFGQWDYTARLVPSLCGIALLWLVLEPMRRHLGERGALWSAGLLAISPAIVAYSRRLLHDSLVLLLTLGAVLCFLSALEHPASSIKGRAARVGLVALLVLFVATKANAFFIIAMILAFWMAQQIARFWLKAGKFEPSVSWVPPAIWLFVSASAMLFPRDNVSPEALKTFQHGVFSAIALLSCVALGFWLFTRQQNEETKVEIAPDAPLQTMLTYLLSAGIGALIFWFLYGHWAQTGAAMIAAKSFDARALVQSLEDARLAMPKMLEYWGGQQKTPRLPARHDYYLVLLLLYEIPILVAGLGGLIHAAKNRSRVGDLLIWWALTSWTLYAVANEKVPWLSVHILLPFALLGGLWLEQVRLKTAAFAATIIGGLFCLRGVWATSFGKAGDHAEPLFYAQTPDAFQEALHGALRETPDNKNVIWLTFERQWPCVWYVRSNAPFVNGSPMTFGDLKRNPPTPAFTRVCVAHEAEWDKLFVPAGWQGEKVVFLIWPRASWEAIEPQRYFPWFWTRIAIPDEERGLPHEEWRRSILSGAGEWSHAETWVGHTPPT